MSKCAMCASLLLYSRTSAQLHLASMAVPTFVYSHTASSRPNAPCLPPASLVLFVWCRSAWWFALHLARVCPPALHLWAKASGQWNPCNPMNTLSGGYGQCNSRYALPHFLCSGRWSSCTARPHCLGAIGS